MLLYLAVVRMDTYVTIFSSGDKDVTIYSGVHD